MGEGPKLFYFSGASKSTGTMPVCACSVDFNDDLDYHLNFISLRKSV